MIDFDILGQILRFAFDTQDEFRPDDREVEQPEPEAGREA